MVLSSHLVHLVEYLKHDFSPAKDDIIVVFDNYIRDTESSEMWSRSKEN